MIKHVPLFVLRLLQEIMITWESLIDVYPASIADIFLDIFVVKAIIFLNLMINLNLFKRLW